MCGSVTKTERKTDYATVNISIIIFFFNEAGTLKKVFDRVHGMLQNAKMFHSYEIILVNDGSVDGSQEIAREIAKEYSETVVLLNHKKNKGIGEALKSGYKHATLEYICAIPADNQFNVEQLLNIHPFGNEEFISFYRVSNQVYSLYRNLLSKLNKWFNQMILGMNMKDVNWIKVYRKDQIDRINVELSTSIVESEICAKLHRLGCRPLEIPSTYENRVYGISTAGNLESLKRVISETLELYRSVSRFIPEQLNTKGSR
jgi:glycosyltransferase involved in cell wall biosynthesis